MKCAGKLQDAVRATKCTTADMKGKKVEYTVNQDHKVGKITIKDRATSAPATELCVVLDPASQDLIADDCMTPALALCECDGFAPR